MLRKGQEGHVRAERDVLKAAALAATPAGSEWIVRLFYSFQDRDHLYLVLEFMGGGDLLNLLIERDVFEEDFTRFYVAEVSLTAIPTSTQKFNSSWQMVLAIEACHKHGFIHRDIKPDVRPPSPPCCTPLTLDRTSCLTRRATSSSAISVLREPRCS